MNVYNQMLAAVAAGGLLAAPLGATAATMSANGMTARTSDGTADTTFASKFAMAGAAEIAMAKLALTHSTNPQVVSFAKKMIADHTTAGMALHSLATPKGLATPMKPDAPSAAMAKSLASETGASFDSAYKQDNIIGHTKALALLQVETSTGKDPGLLAYAKKQTPVVQMHLTMARNLPTT